MAAFEVIALDTATPQLRAPGASDTYTFPRAVEMPLGTANGVLFLNGSKVVTSGSGLTFDGTSVFAAPRVRLNDANRLDWGDQGEWIVGDNAGAMIFGVDVSEKMRLTSTGLGIGTSSPGYRLDVSGGHARIRGAQALFWGNSDNTNLVSIYNGGSSGASTGQMVFETNGTERLRLKSTGQLRYVPLAADPAGAENGDVYYNSSTNKLRLYAAGAWADLN